MGGRFGFVQMNMGSGYCGCQKVNVNLSEKLFAIQFFNISCAASVGWYTFVQMKFPGWKGPGVQSWHSLHCKKNQ